MFRADWHTFNWRTFGFVAAKFGLQDGGATWGPAGNVANIPEPISGCEGALVAHPNGNMHVSNIFEDNFVLVWSTMHYGRRKRRGERER